MSTEPLTHIPTCSILTTHAGCLCPCHDVDARLGRVPPARTAQDVAGREGYVPLGYRLIHGEPVTPPPDALREMPTAKVQDVAGRYESPPEGMVATGTSWHDGAHTGCDLDYEHRHAIWQPVTRLSHDRGADGTGSGTTTECPLEGVHEHPFRGPHTFTEWYHGSVPAPTLPALDGEAWHRRVDCAECDCTHTKHEEALRDAV